MCRPKKAKGSNVNRTDKFKDIRDIADAICNGDVVPEQIQQLEQLLTNNEAGQRFYYEYIGMHVHMKTADEPNLEVVRRKMAIEEVIIRPVSSTNNGPQNTNFESLLQAQVQTPDLLMPEHQVTTQKNIAQKKTTKYPFIAVTIITFLVFIAAIIMLFSRTSEHAIAEIIHGRLAINGQGKINADHLFAGQYIVENQVLIQLESGEQLQLENGTRIKLFNNTSFII